jgi:hypothetical protein
MWPAGEPLRVGCVGAVESGLAVGLDLAGGAEGVRLF